MGSLGAPELLIIGVVLILLFGATRLPQTAKGLGQSLRVFRKELRDDDPTPAALPTIVQDQGSTTQANLDGAAAPDVSDRVKPDQT
jgi:sec-independent protein translocase protein TatA